LALRAAARHAYVLERWVLCIPASMDGPTTQWWQGWKAGQQTGTGVVIDLWDETRLRELLLRPEAADVRRHYYNPYRHDGQPGAPAPAGASPAGPRHGRKVGRRTVLAAAAGASAAALFPVAWGILGDSAPERAPDWTFTAGAYVDCNPVVADGVVYVGDGAGLFHAVNAKDGTQRWTVRAGGTRPIFGRPLVISDTVYVGSSDGTGICALDTADGRTRWTYSQAGAVYSGITTDGGIIYFGSQDDCVYALDAATRRRRWLFRTGRDVQSTPAVADGIVYFGSQDKCVYAVDAATGRHRWTYTTGGYITSSPAVADGKVYIGCGDHNVYALDAATNDIDWVQPTGGEIYWSSPALADGLLYIGSTDGKVYALDTARNGHPRWITPLSGQVQGSPAVSAGTLYVGTAIGTSHGKFYALDAATGSIQWTYTPQGRIRHDPAVADGKVCVGCQDGNVYAFHTTPSP